MKQNITNEKAKQNLLSVKRGYELMKIKTKQTKTCHTGETREMNIHESLKLIVIWNYWSKKKEYETKWSNSNQPKQNQTACEMWIKVRRENNVAEICRFKGVHTDPYTK